MISYHSQKPGSVLIDSSDIMLHGYSLTFRSDRATRGDGTMIHIKSLTPAIQCNEFEMGPCECPWVKNCS